MGMFALRNAHKCGLLAWRSKRAHLCTTSARQTGFGYLGSGRLKLCIPDTPTRYQQNLFLADLVQSYGRLERHPKNPTFLVIAHFKHPHMVSEQHFAGRFSAEVCVLGALCQKATFFRIVQCKHPHTRCPKTPFSGPCCAEAWSVEAPPQNPSNIF